jgi:hypothetical protein
MLFSVAQGPDWHGFQGEAPRTMITPAARTVSVQNQVFKSIQPFESTIPSAAIQRAINIQSGSTRCQAQIAKCRPQLT